MRILIRQPRVIGGAAVLLAVLIGLITWALWPHEHQRPAQPRERQYKTTAACLLTDDKGLSGDIAKTTWAAMQEASLASGITVRYLPIVGPQNTANGLSYYNTLGVQKCTVIIAAGPVPVAAMTAGYRQFQSIENVAVGKPATQPSPEPPSTVHSSAEPLSTGHSSPGRSSAGVVPSVSASKRVLVDPPITTITTIDIDSSPVLQRRIKEIVANAAGR